MNLVLSLGINDLETICLSDLDLRLHILLLVPILILELKLTS